MQPGNFVIDWICDSEGEANGAATGGNRGDCVSAGGVTDLNNVAPAQSFGGAGTYIVAPLGGNRSTTSWAVSRIRHHSQQHRRQPGRGCQVQRRRAGSRGPRPERTTPRTATLSTRAVDNQPQVDVLLEGTNRSQPMGTKGTVSIRIRNRTGGTIKGGIDGIKIRNVLPPEYVVDPTFDPVIIQRPATGLYTRDGRHGDVGRSRNPGYPNPHVEQSGRPACEHRARISLDELGAAPGLPERGAHDRDGNDVIIRFRVVLIDPSYYDLEAYVDVREERPASTARHRSGRVLPDQHADRGLVEVLY